MWASVVSIVAYEGVAIGMKSTPVDLLINNNFFFLSAVMIGMVAGYALERGLRTELAAHNVRLDSALRASFPL